MELVLLASFDDPLDEDGDFGIDQGEYRKIFLSDFESNYLKDILCSREVWVARPHMVKRLKRVER